MDVEIERKFLVDSEIWKLEKQKNPGMPRYKIIQYYFPFTDPIIRIRIIDDATAELTLKANRRGITTDEVNIPIPLADARRLLPFVRRKIEKMRYNYSNVGNCIWVVDEFPSGLILAEVELESETQIIKNPSFVTIEVTDNIQFTNFQLSNPI